MTDPRNDLRLSEPFSHHPDSADGVWGWIAGSGIVVLIAIILIAGWSSNTVPPAATSGSAPMTSPTTNGTAPKTHLKTPAKPAAPAMPKPGTQ